MDTKYFMIALIAALLLLSGCYSESSESDAMSGEGKSGSMARFAVVGDYLYTVDQQKISAFDLTDPGEPMFMTRQPIGFDIETIFPMDTMLFVGAQSGVTLFSLKMPQAPRPIGHFSHVVSCDPVVSDGSYAYVTLSTNQTRCFRGENTLQVLDYSDVSNIQLVKSYPMQSPQGLGVSDSLLIVCDDGIKAYSTKEAPELQLMSQYLDETIQFRDVIVLGDRLMAICQDGLYQFRVEEKTWKIQRLSKLAYASNP